jgi:hypothetical protein
MRKMVIVAFVSLILVGCSSENSGASLGGEDDAQVRINDSDGNEAVNISIGGDLDVDMPDGYTIYPGAMVVTKANVDQGDSIALVLTLFSEDSLEKLAAFYRNQAEAAGVEFSMETADQGMQMFMGKAPDGGLFAFSAAADEEGTSAQLTVGVAKGS